MPLHWKHGVLTTGLPGKSQFFSYLIATARISTSGIRSLHPYLVPILGEKCVQSFTMKYDISLGLSWMSFTRRRKLLPISNLLRIYIMTEFCQMFFSASIEMIIVFLL